MQRRSTKRVILRSTFSLHLTSLMRKTAIVLLGRRSKGAPRATWYAATASANQKQHTHSPSLKKNSRSWRTFHKSAPQKRRSLSKQAPSAPQHHSQLRTTERSSASIATKARKHGFSSRQKTVCVTSILLVRPVPVKQR